MDIANAEVEGELFDKLRRLGLTVTSPNDDAEVFISVDHMIDLNAEVLEAIEAVCNMGPDECSIVDGRLRLWWD